MLKSDNANGLFGFEGPCQPSATLEEGVVSSCVVKRDRGDSGFVDVAWEIEQVESDGSVAPSSEDFTNSSGVLSFGPGELRQVCARIRSPPTPSSSIRSYQHCSMAEKTTYGILLLLICSNENR